MSLPSLICSVLGSDRAWTAIAPFCETVMSQKKDVEGESENSPQVHPLRRPGVRVFYCLSKLWLGWEPDPLSPFPLVGGCLTLPE